MLNYYLFYCGRYKHSHTDALKHACTHAHTRAHIRAHARTYTHPHYCNKIYFFSATPWHEKSNFYFLPPSILSFRNVLIIRILNLLLVGWNSKNLLACTQTDYWSEIYFFGATPWREKFYFYFLSPSLLSVRSVLIIMLLNVLQVRLNIKNLW